MKQCDIWAHITNLRKLNNARNVVSNKLNLKLPGVLDTDLAGVLRGVDLGVEAADRRAGGLRSLWLSVLGSPGAEILKNVRPCNKCNTNY